MLIKRFDKLLETLLGHSGLQPALLIVLQGDISNSLKIKVYSYMPRFAMNVKIDDLCLGLISKLRFSTGDLKDVKKYLFCPKEMFVWNRDLLSVSKC